MYTCACSKHLSAFDFMGSITESRSGLETNPFGYPKGVGAKFGWEEGPLMF